MILSYIILFITSYYSFLIIKTLMSTFLLSYFLTFLIFLNKTFGGFK